MIKIKRFFYNKIIFKILTLLKQGVTPEKLALTFAIAFVIGIFPVIGSTTLLCSLIAISFGLNLPVIQAVNYLVYPLQFVFLIPFYNAGQFLFGRTNVQFTVEKVIEMISSNVWNAIQNLFTVTLHAILVWLLIAPLISAIIYWVFYFILKIIFRKYHQNVNETPSI